MPDIPLHPPSPSVPTTLRKIIRSYLYWEYRFPTGDDNLSAFVKSYNTIGQQFLDWFNALNLPIYTAPNIIGLLLDWVATGLYGYKRPVLGSGHNRFLGPYNTFFFNPIKPVVPLNRIVLLERVQYTPVTDDIYKRCLTWHFFKGDGKVFTIRWLKRRIMRFLTCPNGTAFPVDQTYQIGITFGVDHQVNITIWSFRTTLTGGAIFNRLGFNQINPIRALNSITISIDQLPRFDFAAILKEAIEQGALELPFQYNFVVRVT